jgi:lysophospholipase L1-like esterase
MKRSRAKSLVAVLLLAAVAACSGGGETPNAGPIPAAPAGGHAKAQSSILERIVGVGDSLTAGYQSNGFFGEAGVTNPFYPPHPIPPGQENGWWADLVEQASGLPLDTAIAQMYDPATSPLPLIKAPGLNDQLVPTADFPFGELKSGNTCTDNGGFNQAGYFLKGLSRVRLNPTSTKIRDVGVPGMTLHEANVLHQPQTTSCEPLPGTAGLISAVVTDESSVFWPVLGNFVSLGANLTQVNAAASRHPTLATVWLGANDVLKYMGSGGRFVGGDRTPGQVSSDLDATISTLQRAGARVILANLPNVLETGYFQRVDIPRSHRDCKIHTYASCLLALLGIPASVVTDLADEFHLATPHGCVPATETEPCGYLTLSGTVEVLQYFSTYGEPPNLDCATPAPHCKAVSGSGLGGNYITPAFAGKVQALNDAVNEGIEDAATSSHVPLVDIMAIFHGIYSGDPANPYFRAAASINPGVCCALGYLAGIFSFDGLHPSNTGYALLAYDFIKTINQAYGTHIPEIDFVAAYKGTRCSNKRYCFPDPYAPPNYVL